MRHAVSTLIEAERERVRFVRGPVVPVMQYHRGTIHGTVE